MNAPSTRLPRNGRFITFYSYKGGTGRSMALANIAWTLAQCGKRVLTIDWDLEAPGLHRYFEPYLTDRSVTRSTGLVDFILSFATAAVSGQSEIDDPGWFIPYSNLLAHAVSVKWEFPDGGTLDFVPAGRQDAAYANRVNSFNWQNFYEKLGGGVLFESVKEKLRELYDFILVDSRTGVSDTAGICTVQMPDELVVCYTLNHQSIYGAAAAARSALQQRRTQDGQSTLKIWPVPMRVERSEKDRLEIAQTIGRTMFSALMTHMDPLAIDAYWSEISIDYEPYYAYEEVLAVFKDHPKQSGSVLSKMQAIAQRLSAQPLSYRPPDETIRAEGLLAYTARSAADYVVELGLLAGEYEKIRQMLGSGGPRTEQMNSLVRRVRVLSGRRDAGSVAEQLFRTDSDGGRIVGIALARMEPQRRHIDMALEAISNSRSAFEQFHALLLMQTLTSAIDPVAAQQALHAIQGQLEKTITGEDSSRWKPAVELISTLSKLAVVDARAPANEPVPAPVGAHSIELIECKVFTSVVRYEDAEDSHGPFVTTRGAHRLSIPSVFRISKYPITNRSFWEFVQSGGYQEDEFWTVPKSARGKFLTGSGKTLGPANWLDANVAPEGKANHPVSGICFLEAQAFAQWCNATQSGWTWNLPSEDVWEFAARGSDGLIYPWGDAFHHSRCNSAESGIGGTSPITQFESGKSHCGCGDMAGNVWEFVLASDAGADWCVLRGGSYKNTASEVRSYLRLVRVPIWHRAPDFGFRLVHTQNAP